jgi:tRNA dimethylallyltransferase
MTNIRDVSLFPNAATPLFPLAGGDSLPATPPLSSDHLVDKIESEHPLVVIAGPTAAGKSVLAVHLAERIGGEIVNYDSVQLYRGFDIGSGKLSADERRGVPHHLIDVAQPNQLFTAGDYRCAALNALESIRQRQNVPIFVGGTGLYLRALLLGLFEGPPRSQNLRKRLAARAGKDDTYLHRLLHRLDCVTAARIHPRDIQKIIRAIEVCVVAGQPMSAMLARGRQKLRGFHIMKIGLNPNRAELADRINQRVEHMFAAGLMSEARAALISPGAADVKVLGALGYRQACLVLQGLITEAEAIRQTQAATRQYAKRQLTWFRRERDVTWFKGFGDSPEVQQQAGAWLCTTDSGCNWWRDLGSR